MRRKSRLLNTSPVPLTPVMSDSNGVLEDQGRPDGLRPSTSRVSSASMMRSGAFNPRKLPLPHAYLPSVQASSESSPSESIPWSSAIGHAGTGKSGRVIERLQGDIDRLRREKQLLTTRLDETEKEKETLKTRNQSLQDRTSNYEQSHEASLRQLARRERQVEELREELKKERQKTAQAEAQMAAATTSEEIWRNQANQAKALALQRESEYDTIVACRKVDHDRHQGGIDKIRGEISTLLRVKEDDLEKKKKLEIIAEQQRETIAHLEDVNRKLTTNFKTYRNVVDNSISELHQIASLNDQAVTQKLEEMTEVVGHMRWVMNVDKVVNHHQNGFTTRRPDESRNEDASRPQTANEVNGKRSRSPTKLIKHKRKDSTKATK
jgi:hypothetical protein